jgi:4-hydroxybenzoyl-CoA reductase subunit beta
MTWSMPNFAITRPRDIGSAITAREQESSSLFLAGGTDLLVNLRLGLGRPKLLIDLSAIDALHEKSFAATGVRIGACTSLMELTDMPAIRQRYRALAEAAEAVASPTTRSIATIGGNLCLQTRCVYYNQSEWWRRANNYCLKHAGAVCHVAPQGQRCHAAFSGELETLVQKQVQPMRTTTISAHYRRLAAAALVRRLTTTLAFPPHATGENRQE